MIFAHVIREFGSPNEDSVRVSSRKQNCALIRLKNITDYFPNGAVVRGSFQITSDFLFVLLRIAMNVISKTWKSVPIKFEIANLT